MEEAASRLEREHVHRVYDKIAPYFNDSRYKAWPKVRQFLLQQPPGSLVADVGCGNGKYLSINKDVVMLGCDVCRPLVDYAWKQGHQVQLCDGLNLPYRDGVFDAVLSIAVVHHLSTEERRIRAIREMARCLRAGGRLMISVWALEQKRRRFEKQDVFVPWNPDPHSSPGHAMRRRHPGGEGGAQSAGGNACDPNEHRKVRSASSSVAGERDLARAETARRSPRTWFFSRSLDSVFDFGSLSIARAASSPARQSGCQQDRARRGRGLMKRVSSFFSMSSVLSLEEDVFQPASDFHDRRNAGKTRTQAPRLGPTDATDIQTAPVAAMVQEYGSLALPDLVPSQREQPGHPLEEEMGRDKRGGGQQQMRESPEEREGQAPGSCLRYYHVFREGELSRLIENHVEELHIISAYFDHANWCVVAEKNQVWKI